MSALAGTLNAPAEEEMTLRKWIAVFGAILGAFMAVLDIQITNSSIREITGGLGGTLEDGSWISTAYLVAEIVVIPLSGWFTQVFSLRTYLLGTAGLFLFFSICCGFSWSMNSLIAFRALQGLTGGALIPLAFQVMLSLPMSKRPLGMALFSITATFAPAIGPTVGGYLTDIFHWPILFYLNIAPGILLLAACLYAIDPQPKKLDLLKNVDRWGILTMAVGLSSLTIFLEEGERKDWFSSPLITTLAFTSAIFLAAFLYIELNSPKPFINLRLMMRRNFGLGSLANFVVGMAMYGALFLLPTYLSTIQNYNSIYIGKTMMWAGLPQLLILPFLPKLLKRFDSRWMAFLGINIFALSCFMNSRMSPLVGIDQLKWSQIVRAMGQPMIMVPLSTITMGMIEKEQAGSASGLFNMLRNLGGSVGIAVLSTFLTVREQFHSARIGETVTKYSIETQQRIQNMTVGFVEAGSDPVSSFNKALGIIDFSIRKQATVMAYNDCFYFVATALVMSSALILLCRKVGAPTGPSEAH